MSGCGAIDLGGTKIEARLFDADMRTVAVRRVPTPQASFDSFADALAGEIGWLLDGAGAKDLPVGVCLPGMIDPETGLCFAGNIPVAGRNLGAALRDRLGRAVVFANDSLAFAYSEAHGGAGENFSTVVGLILGTGVGAGLVADGSLPHRHNGMASEVGHVGLPATLARRHDLADIPCGCGRQGCLERYVSGGGLSHLAERFLNARLSPAEIEARAAAGDAAAEAALTVWTDCAAEVLLTLQLAFDPDCVVVGGGLSKLPGLLDRLTPAFAARLLGHTRAPALRLAEHGDSSGARGVALLARHGEVAA